MITPLDTEFDLKELLGCEAHNYTLWLGPANGDGQSGLPDIDAREYSLKEINWMGVIYKSFLETQAKEYFITGAEKLLRAKEKTADKIRLGGRAATFLKKDYEKNKGWCMLEIMRIFGGINSLIFLGVVLAGPGIDPVPHCRYFIKFDHVGNGVWKVNVCREMDSFNGEGWLSPLLTVAA